jgi:prophage antirepressor-like protein
MSTLSTFTFENHPVRFVGTPQQPEWIAQDVCNVFAIKNASDTLASFDRDEKGIATIYTPGGDQQMLTVTEPGLYRLIFKSRKTVAKRFQRWVFHEVLPSIRKTGSYTLPQPELERLKLELD